MSAEATSYRSGVPARDPEFERLHHRFYPAVLAYCLRRVQAADAHDAAAETFVVAWRRFDAIPAGDRALPWLYGVARRVLLHKYRRASRDARLIQRLTARPVPIEPGPELQLVRSAEHDLVHQAAARLRPADREILRLHLWEELSHAQVAEVLGIEIEAAKQRFHRAKKRLVRHFDRIRGPEGPPTTAPRGGAP